MDFIPSIELNIPEKLRDAEYRRQFFMAEASADIARQLIALRKLRGLSQSALAQGIGTKQSGISRVESADYSNWSFNTLRKITEILDARLRIVIEPAEDVLHEYAELDEAASTSAILEGLSQERPLEQHQGASILTEIGKSQNEANLSGRRSDSILGRDSRQQRATLSA